MNLNDIERVTLNGKTAVRMTLNGNVVWEAPTYNLTPQGAMLLSNFDELHPDNQSRLLLSGDAQQTGNDALLI